MIDFKTPVSMFCTQEQYERDLRTPLLEMGYKERSVTPWHEYPVLTNNYNNKIGELGNVLPSWANNLNRYFIGHYNPELFLALAAMTDHNDAIIGEYWMCTNTVVMNDTGIIANVEGKLYKTEKRRCITDEQGDINHIWDSIIGEYFRKATKEEIIDNFRTKEEMKTFKVTRKQMREIYDIACSSWKTKIDEMLKTYFAPYECDGNLPESVVQEMFGAANTSQTEVLNRIFPEYIRDRNAFIEEFEVGYLKTVSQKLFGNPAAFQIGMGSAPEDLRGRCFYVKGEYEVKLQTSGDDTLIIINKK